MIQSAESLLLIISAQLPIVDPIGVSPVILSLTRDDPPEMRRVRRVSIGLTKHIVASARWQ